MNTNTRIYVAGGDTLIGTSLINRLQESGCIQVYGGPEEPDLTVEHEVDAFFASSRPEIVFVAAGRSGGIAANLHYPADLMRDNLLVACNLIHSAFRHGVRKLVYLASSCSFPRLALQPMAEESLLTGPLEPTNEAYAIAKIAGIKLCQAYRQQFGARFISVIPANAFGPGDDFSPEDSHVIAGLVRRIHEAKIQGRAEVVVWGSGNPRREFIFGKDLADACIFVMKHYDGFEPINLGVGTTLSIRELAEAICKIVGYPGRLRFDTSKPDGMPHKALDSSKLFDLGWRPRFSFADALVETYTWFLQWESQQESMHARTSLPIPVPHPACRRGNCAGVSQ